MCGAEVCRTASGIDDWHQTPGALCAGDGRLRRTRRLQGMGQVPVLGALPVQLGRASAGAQYLNDAQTGLTEPPCHRGEDVITGTDDDLSEIRCNPIDLD